MTFKKTLYQLHKWCGLTLAVFLLLQALSGSLLVFKEDLRASLLPDTHTAVPQAQSAALDTIAEAARSAWPEYRLDRLILPRSPDRAVIARFLRGDGGYAFASLDPYTAEVLQYGGYLTFPFEGALFFHHEWLSGIAGQWLVRILGLCLLLLSLTGLILGWPGFRRLRKSLAVRFAGRPWLAIVFGLHKSLGLLAVVTLVLTALTGTAIAWRPILTAGDQYATIEAPAPGSLARISLESAATRVQHALTGAELRDVRFFERADDVFFTVYDDVLLNPRGIHQAQVDLGSGRITWFYPSFQRSGKEVFLDWMLPVHSGEVLWIPGKLLVFLTGLSLAALSATGVMVWLERRQIRTRRQRATPTEPAAMAQLPRSSSRSD